MLSPCSESDGLPCGRTVFLCGLPRALLASGGAVLSRVLGAFGGVEAVRLNGRSRNGAATAHAVFASEGGARRCVAARGGVLGGKR
jgi:hypothetical protein